MENFDRCIHAVLSEEGGLSDHPQDPGGLTKYGISQRAEYRVSEFVSTFVCKRHGDVVPLARMSYPARAEPARASRE